MIAVDLLNNDGIYVTSNWWGQNWGLSSEPVRLTKFGACPLPQVAGHRLVGYTGRPAPVPPSLSLSALGVKKGGGARALSHLPAYLPACPGPSDYVTGPTRI